MRGLDDYQEQLSMSEMPEILTAKHIAGYLHISLRRAYELLSIAPSIGGIPSLKIGKSKRAKKADFQQWLEERKTA